MADWFENLESYHRFCNDPDQLSSEDVRLILAGFLDSRFKSSSRASKLLTDIPVTDIFDV
jgi:hypothetical protein